MSGNRDERRHESDAHPLGHNDARDDSDDALCARLAALPRDVAPPADLWRGVESRIVAQQASARAEARKRGRIQASVIFAAAAGLAVAFWYAHADRADLVIARVDAIDVAASIAARASDAPAPPEADADDGVLAEEPSYRAAIALLRASFAERRESLSQENAVAVDESVRVLDAAISETRAALVEKPDDDDLRAELGDAYQLEIDVLDDALDLPSRS